MNNRLFFRIRDRFCPKDEGMFEWFLYQGSELLTSEIGDDPGAVRLTLSEYGVSDVLCKFYVVVPSEWVTLTMVELPTKQVKHIARALPFALEDSLANEVESLHFAIAIKAKEERIPTAVVSRSKMDEWLGWFAGAGWKPDYLLPDSLLLPFNTQSWTLLLEGHRAVLRNGPYTGMAVPASQLSIVLDAMLKEADTEQVAIRIFVGEDYDESTLSLDVLENDLTSGEYGVNIEFQRENLTGDVSSVFLSAVAEPTIDLEGINLLQADYKPKVKSSSLGINWKPLAAMVALFVVVQLSLTIGQTIHYSAKVDELDQESKTLFKKMFPNVRRIVDIKRQAMQELKGDTGSTNSNQFMMLLAKTGEQVNQLKRSKKTVEIRRIIFDEGQGNIRMDMELSDFPDLDLLKSNIEKSGLSVEVDQVTKDGDKVKTRIKVKA